MYLFILPRFLNGGVVRIGGNDTEDSGTLNLIDPEEGSYRCRAVSDQIKTFSREAIITIKGKNDIHVSRYVYVTCVC